MRSFLWREKTFTPFEKNFFMCFVCEFKVKVLSMYMPKDLVEMEKGTVVLLILSFFHRYI